MSGREICGVNESFGGHRCSLLHYAAYCCCCFYCAPPQSKHNRDTRAGRQNAGKERRRGLGSPAFRLRQLLSFLQDFHPWEETCGRVISYKSFHGKQREHEEWQRAQVWADLRSPSQCTVRGEDVRGGLSPAVGTRLPPARSPALSSLPLRCSL